MNSTRKLNIIPPVAMVTTNYIEFCRLIIEKLNDTQFYIRSILLKIEKELHILNNAKDLKDRDKKVIDTYLNRLETELHDVVKVRDELLKLKNNENAMRRAFCNKI